MAPNLGSPANSHNRFSSGFCSTSMAPTPASGFSFDPLPHMQRYVQSSTSSNGDTAFQIQQFYMQQSRQHAALQNTGSAPVVDIQRASNEADSTVAELPLEDPQLGQALQSFVQENMSAGPIPAGLMRYHSAPSSMLGSLTGMGNAIMNHDGELDQFLSSSTLHLDSKEDLKPMDNSHGIEDRCLVPGMGAGAMDFLSNCNSGFVSSPYERVRSVTDNNNNNRPQIGMDADGVPFPRASDALSESGRGSALELPSSYNLRSSFATDTAHLENGNGLACRMPVSNNTLLESGNGIVRGVPISKNSLMRHSSSPAGLLSQLNDDQERHMLGSSSGNSSEEGSYDRQDSKSLLASYRWDEAGNVMVRSPHASNAARKRIRDLEEKCYAASTVMESQKGDAMEHGVLGNYFGTSPENTFFTDKLSPDSIPCRTRAKRGCATHPRSIAERVRRTKISERMKKLQELVPNMDKQTNTAEMLDEAVEYVKDLQRQVQELTEGRSNCKCSCGRPKETSSR